MGDQSVLNTTSSILSSKLSYTVKNDKKSCIACCMINKKDLLPILDDVSHEFSYLANIVTSQEEMICGNCLAELISACNFKRRCIFSKKKMKSASIMTLTDACNSASATNEVPTLTSKPCRNPCKKKNRAESIKSLQSTNKITAGSDKPVGSNKDVVRVNGIRRSLANKDYNKFASQQFPKHIVTASDHGSTGSLLRSRSADNIANYYGKMCREVFSKMDDFKKHKSRHFSKLTNLFMNEIGNPRAPVSSPISRRPPRTSRNLREISGVCPFVKQKAVKKQCERCGKVLTDLNKHKCLTEHISSSLSKTYPCDTCGKMLNSYKSLWSHKKFVHNDSNSKSKLDCLMCTKSYSNASARREHMITKHGTAPLPHVCKTCSKQFPSTTKLKRHLSTHKNALSYECFICMASFTETADLLHHMKSNHNNILAVPNEITKTLPIKL